MALSAVPGDWLEKLNGQNVTHRDLNDILSSINSREIVSKQNQIKKKKRIISFKRSSRIFSKKLHSIKRFGRLLFVLEKI